MVAYRYFLFWTTSTRALIFHINIPCNKTFPRVPLFFTLWPWPWSLTHFFENFNIAYNFWIVSARALIFHMNILSMGTIIFDPVTLTLEFCRFFLKILTLLITWIVSARAWIFHMSIPCDKTFLRFHYFLINIRVFILHMSISCDKIFLLVSRYLFLWPWPSLELAIIGGICVYKHILFYD